MPSGPGTTLGKPPGKRILNVSDSDCCPKDRLSEEHLSGIGKCGGIDSILKHRSGHGDPSSFGSKVKPPCHSRSGAGQTQLSVLPKRSFFERSSRGLDGVRDRAVASALSGEEEEM